MASTPRDGLARSLMRLLRSLYSRLSFFSVVALLKRKKKITYPTPSRFGKSEGGERTSSHKKTTNRKREKKRCIAFTFSCHRIGLHQSVCGPIRATNLSTIVVFFSFSLFLFPFLWLPELNICKRKGPIYIEREKEGRSVCIYINKHIHKEDVPDGIL